MSTTRTLCYVLNCDGPGRYGRGCGAQLGGDLEQAPLHWPTRADARAAAPGFGWETPDGPDRGPDLCPDCRCRRDGHDFDDPYDGLRCCCCCCRCGEGEYLPAYLAAPDNGSAA